MAKFTKLTAAKDGLVEESTVTTSAGVGDAGKVPNLDAGGKLDASMLPDGTVPTTVAAASEALTAGSFVDIYNDAGTTKVRLATAATSGKTADGFVIADVAQDADATVYTGGINKAVTGVTAGPVYLSATTPGAFTSTPPSSSGNVVQEIGTGVGATAIAFQPKMTVTLE